MLALLASVPLAAGLWMSWRIHQASGWPQAEARIFTYGVASPTIPIAGSFDRGYQPSLECIFEAQGRRWACRRPLLFPGWFSEKEAREYSERVGRRILIPRETPGSFWSGVVVRYNPAHPEESVVEVNGRWPANGLVVVGAAFLALVIAFAVHRRRE